MLSWVHQDLEDQLTRVRHDLDAYSHGERDRLETCGTQLHRVHGVVQMLGLYDLGLLLQELESLARDLHTGQVKAVEEACELLLKGVLQLSDYLNRLDAGYGEGPQVLMPLLNDLRSVRRRPLLSEGVLFTPSLENDPPLRNRRPPLDERQFRSYVRRLRTYFQHGLVGWFQHKSDEQGIMLLRAVVAQLERLSGDAPCAKLWWVAGGVVEALRDGGLSASVAVRRLLAQFDARLRHLADVGPRALDEPPPTELLKNLLYYVTRATSDGGRVSAVRDVFNLNELPLARDSDAPTAGRDASEMRFTVASALKAELASINELLDVWARGDSSPNGQMDNVFGQLRRAADALALFNFGQCHSLVVAQIRRLRRLSEDGQRADESVLLEVARALLEVDAALAEVGPRDHPADSPAAQTALSSEPGETRLSEHELQRLGRTVILEAQRELTEVKRIVDGQLSGDWAGDPVESIALSVHRVAGSLRILSLSRAADLTEEWVRQARPLLLAAEGDSAWVALDAMADVLVGLECYLAVLLGQEPGDESTLAATERRLGELKAYTQRLPDISDSSGTAGADAPSRPPAPVAALLGHEADAVEDDIVAVFSSEAREVLRSLREDLDRWVGQIDDPLVLADVRRGFHTLKGSGRLVGAYELGELCWIVENLLNQVIEGTCSPTDAVRELVVSAWRELPSLLAAFERNERSDFDLAPYSVKATRALHAGRSASREEAAGAWTVDGLDALEPDANSLLLPDESAVPVDIGPVGPVDIGPALSVDIGLPAPVEAVSAAPVEASPPAPSDSGAVPAHELGAGNAQPVADAEEPRRLFWQEAVQSLEFMGTLLRQWATMPDDRQCVLELQRELHTLKGGARISNLQPFGDLSHAMESALVPVGEGRIAVTDGLFELIEQCHDRLQEMLELAGEAGDVADPSDLIERLESLARDPRPSTDAVRPATAPAAAATASEGKLEPRADSTRDVRVPATFLDSLAHYAGDIGLSQSRLGQQVGAYRSHLEELDRTVGRLKDQLRRLDLGAYPAAPSAGGNGHRETELDPLVMERQARTRQIARGLAESVSDLESIQGLLQSITEESGSILEHQVRISTSLQQGLVRTRTVSIAGLVDRFRRLVRRTMRDLGKRVELRIEGGDLQLDRAILELLTPSLEHMLRNAVDHGIESPGDRVAAGKPPTGRVRLSFARVASELEIQVVDDGLGLHGEAMRAKAIERGVLEEHARPVEDELYQLILEPGFSTASNLTQISGRGVGLDAVNARVKELGGTLGIQSRPNAGCTFTIRVPFTPALNQALLVDVGDETLALPLGNIRAVARMTSAELSRLRAQRAPRYEHGGRRWPLVALGELLGFEADHDRRERERVTLVLVGAADAGVALEVDALVGRHEIAVKPLSPQLSGLRWVTGATILGDGRVAMILNVPALIRRGLFKHRDLDEAGLTPGRPAARPGPPRILVVDDSITMRKVTQRLLSRHGMEVITARDGEEAMSLLEAHGSDLMLLDIEMPRMDGFQVIESVRANYRFEGLPIVVITSRSGAKHSDHAKGMGVDRYIGKPYVEEELLGHIQDLLGER